jgi:hypothetical protein
MPDTCNPSSCDSVMNSQLEQPSPAFPDGRFRSVILHVKCRTNKRPSRYPPHHAVLVDVVCHTALKHGISAWKEIGSFPIRRGLSKGLHQLSRRSFHTIVSGTDAIVVACDSPSLTRLRILDIAPTTENFRDISCSELLDLDVKFSIVGRYLSRTGSGRSTFPSATG